MSVQNVQSASTILASGPCVDTAPNPIDEEAIVASLDLGDMGVAKLLEKAYKRKIVFDVSTKKW
ncbi:MAG: hypothetical protein ABI947_02010 [Chloroflexota bacterium]